jgi:hypothetical protein
MENDCAPERKQVMNPGLTKRRYHKKLVNDKEKSKWIRFAQVLSVVVESPMGSTSLPSAM